MLCVDVWESLGMEGYKCSLAQRKGGWRGDGGVVWTDWGCHGNPAAKSRQGQCGIECAAGERDATQRPLGELHKQHDGPVLFYICFFKYAPLGTGKISGSPTATVLVWLIS